MTQNLAQATLHALACDSLSTTKSVIFCQKKFYKLILLQDPRQIFYGLEPGWIVSMQDKTIFKPSHPDLNDVYAS